eukprot:GGOE01056274.1.p1 GENE.GGOE01056274.1~~GGOE01056274.1.p1  ORF type:complete len:253 (-),score=53.53 GGOE01056274.1:242-967(-)
MPEVANSRTGFFTPDLSKAAKFPTAPRRPIFDAKQAADLPGPGAYSVNSSLLSSKGARIGGQQRFRSNSAAGRLEGAAPDSPGPAAYDTKLSPNLKGGVITRALRPSPVKEVGSSPGPCQYAAQSSLSAKGVPFPRAPRSGKDAFSPKEDSPGPCAYNPQRSGYSAAVVSFPKQKRRMAELAPGEQSPGPCAYATTISSFRPQSGCTFGRAKREVRFGSKESLPGPGEYTPVYAFESRFTK